MTGRISQRASETAERVARALRDDLTSRQAAEIVQAALDAEREQREARQPKGRIRGWLSRI